MSEKQREVEIDDKYRLVKRSNDLIEAKYSSSLREKKLFLLAISHLGLDDVYNDETGPKKLVSVLTVPQIKAALGLTGNDMYTYLKRFSSNALQFFMFLEERRPNGSRSFKYINMVSTAEFDTDTGLFVITFNEELRKHTLEVKSHFTLLDARTLLSLSSSSAFRLYEILGTQLYHIPAGDYKTTYAFEYNLAELRFALGLINGMDNAEVRRAREAGYSYDYIWRNLLKEKQKYENWNDLKRNVIQRAMTEINEHPRSELAFNFSVVRSGRGGKVSAVRFLLWRKPPADFKGDVVSHDEAQKIIPVYATTELIEEVMKFSNDTFSRDDAIRIIDAAEGNLMFAAVAITSAIRNKRIQNKVDWIVSYIREQYFSGKSPSELVPETYLMPNEEREELINSSECPMLAEILIDDFTVEEIDNLYSVGKSKMIAGMIPFSMSDLWVTDYITYYFDVIKTTKKETKSTPYRRLLNYLRRDYEHCAESLNEKYQRAN